MHIEFKKTDDTYWKVSAQDPNGYTVPVFLNGHKKCHTQKLQGATKRPFAFIRSKSPGLQLYGRRSDCLLTTIYKKFVTLAVTQDRINFVRRAPR